MTPRTLFTIVIKVFGLWLLISSLIAIFHFLSTLYLIVSANRGDVDVAAGIAITVFAFGLLILLMWLCFFKTDIIIDKLSLDKHFPQEEFRINVHRSTVLSIAVLVIGGLIVVDELPVFVRLVFNYIQYKSMGPLYGAGGATNGLVNSIAQMVIGLFLLLRHRTVVNFIELKRRA